MASFAIDLHAVLMKSWQKLRGCAHIYHGNRCMYYRSMYVLYRCYETLSLIHRILGKNKITQDVCLRAGEMFVQANKHNEKR